MEYSQNKYSSYIILLIDYDRRTTWRVRTGEGLLLLLLYNINTILWDGIVAIAKNSRQVIVETIAVNFCVGCNLCVDCVFIVGLQVSC